MASWGGVGGGLGVGGSGSGVSWVSLSLSSLAPRVAPPCRRPLWATHFSRFGGLRFKSQAVICGVVFCPLLSLPSSCVMLFFLYIPFLVFCLNSVGTLSLELTKDAGMRVHPPKKRREGGGWQSPPKFAPRKRGRCFYFS